MSIGASDPPLTLRASPRAKAMRLRLDRRGGGFVLTFPARMSARRALAWAETHRAWMRETAAAQPAGTALTDGAMLPIEGEPHRICWRAEGPRVPRVAAGAIDIGGPPDTVEQRLLRWLKRRARDVLSADTAEYAAKAGVVVAAVGVGDPVWRWGSCSSSGAIRYSWRLLLAPPDVRRATVAHEVAHRVHMNHGPEFHALVAELFGADQAPARLWLRRNGAALHRIGRH